MDMQTDRVTDLLADAALPFLRGRHHDQPRVDRVPREEVRRGAAARRDRHAGHLRARAAARVRARLRGQPAHRARLRAVQEANRVSVDVRGLRHVARRGVRSGVVRPRARTDQQAALDLRLREAADGPGDPRLRHGTGPRLHAVPAVQLDRRGSRLDQHGEGRQLARDHPVPRPHRARRDRSSWWTAARRNARSRTSTTASPRCSGSSPTRAASRRARSTTSATRRTTGRCANSPSACWRSRKSYPEYAANAAKVRLVDTTADTYYGKGYQDVQNRVPKITNTCADLDWKPVVGWKTRSRASSTPIAARSRKPGTSWIDGAVRGPGPLSHRGAGAPAVAHSGSRRRAPSPPLN